MMEAAEPSDMAVHFYQTVWCHMHKDSTPAYRDSIEVCLEVHVHNMKICIWQICMMQSGSKFGRFLNF
jgi:hypothetical protein